MVKWLSSGQMPSQFSHCNWLNASLARLKEPFATSHTEYGNLCEPLLAGIQVSWLFVIGKTGIFQGMGSYHVASKGNAGNYWNKGQEEFPKGKLVCKQLDSMAVTSSSWCSKKTMSCETEQTSPCHLSRAHKENFSFQSVWLVIFQPSFQCVPCWTLGFLLLV